MIILIIPLKYLFSPTNQNALFLNRKLYTTMIDDIIKRIWSLDSDADHARIVNILK